LLKREQLFLLYGSPIFRAFSQVGHWQKGRGVGIAPPEPKQVSNRSSMALFYQVLV